MTNNFDEVGKAIFREIRPYIHNYPFEIISVKENSFNMLEVYLKCKQCDEVIKSRILSSQLAIDNPFHTGMSITRFYYAQHYKHPEEEEP